MVGWLAVLQVWLVASPRPPPLHSRHLGLKLRIQEGLELVMQSAQEMLLGLFFNI